MIRSNCGRRGGVRVRRARRLMSARGECAFSSLGCPTIASTTFSKPARVLAEQIPTAIFSSAIAASIISRIPGRGDACETRRLYASVLQS